MSLASYILGIVASLVTLGIVLEMLRRRRLRERHTESEEAIQRRLAGARNELAEIDCYRHQVVNDDLESARTELRRIVASLFART